MQQGFSSRNYAAAQVRMANGVTVFASIVVCNRYGNCPAAAQAVQTTRNGEGEWHDDNKPSRKTVV